jgi:hypothetical protein
LIHPDFDDCRATGAYDAGGVGLVLELTLRTSNFHKTHFYFLWPTGHKLQSPEPGVQHGSHSSSVAMKLWGAGVIEERWQIWQVDC